MKHLKKFFFGKRKEQEIGVVFDNESSFLRQLQSPSMAIREGVSRGTPKIAEISWGDIPIKLSEKEVNQISGWIIDLNLERIKTIYTEKKIKEAIKISSKNACAIKFQIDDTISVVVDKYTSEDDIPKIINKISQTRFHINSEIKKRVEKEKDNFTEDVYIRIKKLLRYIHTEKQKQTIYCLRVTKLNAPLFPYAQEIYDYLIGNKAKERAFKVLNTVMDEQKKMGN